MEWWMFRSVVLKERPAKTGETVMVCPLGRWTTLGTMVGNYILYSTIHVHVHVHVHVRQRMHEGQVCQRLSTISTFPLPRIFIGPTEGPTRMPACLPTTTPGYYLYGLSTKLMGQRYQRDAYPTQNRTGLLLILEDYYCYDLVESPQALTRGEHCMANSLCIISKVAAHSYR